MRLFTFTSIIIIFYIAQLFAQDHKYPVEDFYNRSIELPIDYENAEPEYIDPFYGCLKKLGEPYLKLIHGGRVALPTFPPLETFREVETEVFYLAGRNDHVSDYRIGIELGKYFRKYELFIADDNHTMSINKECYPLLRKTFLNYGIGSNELQNVRDSLICKEWKQE